MDRGNGNPGGSICSLGGELRSYIRCQALVDVEIRILPGTRACWETWPLCRLCEFGFAQSAMPLERDPVPGAEPSDKSDEKRAKFSVVLDFPT